MAVAVLPALAVSVICGRRLAIATPIWALTACRFASATRTSGRCRTRSAGTLNGSRCGNRNDCNWKVAATFQLQSFRLQLEGRGDLFAREVPGEKGDEVALLGK